MSKVVCFGEIMMRLSPPGYERFVQARQFDIIFGGAEANVAVSLANYGIHARYVSKLPDNPIGDLCRNELRRFGVDVGHVARGGDRMGIFYCEKGAAMRPSNVIYDRAGSAIATAGAADFNWPKILEGASWLHFTGITPALGDNLVDICRQACETAKSMGLMISCDINYRKKLWTRERAGEVLSALMPYVDVLVDSLMVEDGQVFNVFGMRPDGSGIADGQIDEFAFRSISEQLVTRFGVKYVAYTLRESQSASDNGWAGLLYDGSTFYRSREYNIHIVDRVGGGDAFTAGLIYGFLTGMGPQGSLEYAVAAGALKHTIEGDFNQVSAREVKALMGGDASGRVQR